MMVRATRTMKWTHLSILVVAIISVSFLCGSVNAERSTTNPFSKKRSEPVLTSVTTKSPPSKPINSPVPATSKKTVKPTTTGPSLTAEDCSKVRKTFVSKGFPVESAARNPMPGSSLTVCSSSYTCCTREMEKKLYGDILGRVRSSFHSLLRKPYTVLEHREAQLNNYLHKLLNNSYQQMHKMFIQTYGLHYNSNARIFLEFYQMMHQYLNGKIDNVKHVVTTLFDRMGYRMLHMLNLRESQTSGLLRPASGKMAMRLVTCLYKQFQNVSPYGNAPSEITKDLIRSLTAGRTLAMVLGVQREVLSLAMLRMQVTPECQNAITRVNYCALCAGNANAQACPNFCENVVRGCFVTALKLSEAWTSLTNHALKLVNLLDGRNSLEHIFENSLAVKISEAITNFQNNFQKHKVKLYSRCSAPFRVRRSARSLAKSMRRRRRRASGLYPRNRGFTRSSQPGLKRLLGILKNNVLAPQKRILTSSVDNTCRRSPFQTTSDAVRCWNGTAIGPYEGALVPATVAGQASNPEVAVDVKYIPRMVDPILKLMTQAEERVSNAISEREVKHLAYPKTESISFASSTPRERRPNRGRMPEASGDGPNTPLASSGDGELPQWKNDKVKKPLGPSRGNSQSRSVIPKSEQPPPDDENAGGPATGAKSNRQPESGVEGSGEEGSGAKSEYIPRNNKGTPVEVPPSLPFKPYGPTPRPRRKPKPQRKPTPRVPVDDVDLEASGSGESKPDSGLSKTEFPPVKKEPAPQPKRPDTRPPMKPEPLPERKPEIDWKRSGKRQRLPTIPDDQEGNGSGDQQTGNWPERIPHRPILEGSGGSGMQPEDPPGGSWSDGADSSSYPSRVWLPRQVIGIDSGPDDNMNEKKDYNVVGDPMNNKPQNRDCHPKCKAPISTAVNNLLLLLTVALLSAALLV